MVEFDRTSEVPVMEEFLTLQGEGFYSGMSAYFVRLAGCDVGCHWCDVKESWTASKNQIKSIDTIVSRAKYSNAELVVITGGEPCMYNLDFLTQRLSEIGLKTALETSGAYDITGKWHWVCVSPKKFKAPLEKSLRKCNELKVIVFNKSDFKWAEMHREKCNESCKLYLQPEWDQRDKMLPQIVSYINENPVWRLSLQTHKYIGIE